MEDRNEDRINEILSRGRIESEEEVEIIAEEIVYSLKNGLEKERQIELNNLLLDWEERLEDEEEQTIE